MKRISLKHISSLSVVRLMIMLVCVSIGAGLSTAAAQPRAYVANSVDNTVSVINTATNTVIATVPVGLGPIGVAITPDGTRVYVTNSLSDDVSVIETTGNTVIATVSVVDLSGNRGPLGVAITPDGRRAYVTNSVGDVVTVIDTASNRVTATVLVDSHPSWVAITPDGRRA